MATDVSVANHAHSRMRFGYLSASRCSLVYIICYIWQYYGFCYLLALITESFVSQMSRPDYNQIFVKKPELDDGWP
jgi:hypothetical protein